MYYSDFEKEAGLKEIAQAAKEFAKAFGQRALERKKTIAASAIIGGLLAGELGAKAKTERPTRDIAAGALTSSVGLNLLLPHIDKGVLSAKDKIGRYGLYGLAGLGALGLAHIYAKQRGTQKETGQHETQASAMVGALNELKKINQREEAKDAPAPLPFSGHTF